MLQDNIYLFISLGEKKCDCILNLKDLHYNLIPILLFASHEKKLLGQRWKDMRSNVFCHSGISITIMSKDCRLVTLF